MQKIDQLTLHGQIHCESNLRIGGSDDLLQIGGADLTFIKHPVTRKPYIPGSSLKGKMRSELERRTGLFSEQDNSAPYDGRKDKGEPDDELVARIFGAHKNTAYSYGPPRIIVRDSLLVHGGETQRVGNTAINRQTGTAQSGSLRTLESVAQGTIFSLEIGLQIYDIDKQCKFAGSIGADALLLYVLLGLQYVKETGLGSGTSKGFGKIRFSGPEGSGNIRVTHATDEPLAFEMAS